MTLDTNALREEALRGELHPRQVLALIEALEKSQAFEKEWGEKDGNSPGYNREKAVNYGRQACEY